MGAADRVMAGEPAGRRAVAAFAADAVGELEARAARAGRGGRGVAAEAERRGRGVAEAEAGGDPARARLAQHGPGAAVGAGRGRGVLPDHQFVLADDGAGRLGAAVTSRAGAARDADEAAARVAGRGRGSRLEEQDEQERGEERRGSADRKAPATPHYAPPFAADKSASPAPAQADDKGGKRLYGSATFGEPPHGQSVRP